MTIRQAVAMSAMVLTLGLGVARTGAATDDAKRQSTLDATVQFGAPQPQTPPVNVVVPDEVTITKGGTVTWIVNGAGHGIGIYKVSNHTTRDDVAEDLCLDPAVCGAAAANLQYVITDGKGDVVLDTERIRR